jgi:hypothetical protein
MNAQGSRGSGSSGGGGSQGGHTSPLSDATYNMVSSLHNIVDGLWHYDQYIEQESDDDAREMWQRFKDEDTRRAVELRNHLSRRLQHESGPGGQAGHGPNESGGQ